MNTFTSYRATIRRAALGLALVASLYAPLTAHADPIGSIISYQGKITDANGAAVANAQTSVIFKIYEVGNATAVFNAAGTAQDVATIGGVFNAFINVGTLEFDPAKEYELGITTGETDEVRHPIAAVPVAINAKKADSVSGVVAIANGGTGSATKNFVDLSSAQTVDGAKDFTSAVNSTQYNIGGNLVLSLPGTNTVAVGVRAGILNEGDSNVFVGRNAGASNTTGSSNIALGRGAGVSLTTGNNNIAIGNQGVAAESDTTRIGTSQTRAFVAGVRGATALTGTLPVVVDANGQLGVAQQAEYGYIYNRSPQLIPIGGSVVFDSTGALSPGIFHPAGSSTIYCASSGVYKVNFSVSVIEPNQFALFRNGVLVPGSNYGSGAGTQQNNGQAIVDLTVADVLTLVNNGSPSAVSLHTLAGGTEQNVNASILIQKLN